MYSSAHNYSQSSQQKFGKVLGTDPGSYEKSTSPFYQGSMFAKPSQNNNVVCMQPVTTRLNNILQQTTSYRAKCEDLTKLTTACSNKELIEIFPWLLHNIYGYSGGTGWKIHSLTPRSYESGEYNTIFNFLSPRGVLFSLINKLMADVEAVFQFPHTMLPKCIVEEVHNGNLSHWYQNKIVFSTNQSKFCLNFNAMEYYLVIFTYFVLHPNTLQTNQWSCVEEVLYVKLLEEYLIHFFPLNEEPIQSTQTYTPYHSTPPSKTYIFSHSAQSSLLRQQNQQHTYNNSLQTSDSQIFLQILCDFWLGQNTSASDKTYSLPSVDHARMVRVLIKYLHSYVNSKRTLPPESLHAHLSSVIVPALFSERLYLYLKHCFLHWSLDSSFRIVLETWLSYIQPWRYMDSKDQSQLDDTIDFDHSPWRAFISANFFFYTSLFEMFLSRAQRYDLLAVGDAFLVYRVAKVFSQTSLIHLIREGDSEMLEGRYSPTRLLLNPSDQYKSMFSVHCTHMVDDMVKSMASAVVGLRNRILQSPETSSKQGSCLISCIREFFMMDTDHGQQENDDQRVVEYLERSCHMLAKMYQLTPPQTMVPLNPSSSPTNTRLFPALTLSTQPDSVMTPRGRVLTDRGRFQVVYKLRHFDSIYNGDPELHPVRSDENTVAVRWLYKFASYINTNYGEELHNMYNRKDFVSTALVKLSKKLRWEDTVLTPRVSLRFAASYYFIGYAFWFVVLAHLFAFSWPVLIVVGLLLLVLCVAVNVNSKPADDNSLKRD